ncbi:MAG: hypothetical protein QXF32_02610, partial [Candidatus Thermoplasmatota archaeon]
MLEKEPFKSYFSLVGEFYPAVKIESLKEITNKNFRNDILRLNEEEISKILDACEKCIEEVKLLRPNIQEIIKNFPFQEEINKNILNFEALVRLFGLYFLLAAISLILFPHYFSSNYPESGIIGYEEYNEELGVVRASQRLHKIL